MSFCFSLLASVLSGQELILPKSSLIFPQEFLLSHVRVFILSHEVSHCVFSALHRPAGGESSEQLGGRLSVLKPPQVRTRKRTCTCIVRAQLAHI